MAGPLVIKEWQFQLSSDGLQFYQYEQKRTSTSYLHSLNTHKKDHNIQVVKIQYGQCMDE